MDTRKSSESAAGSAPATSDGQPAAKDGGAFRVRYGRTAIALAGLLSVITAVVSGVLRTFGIGNPWLPAVAFLAGAAAVFILRRLAVRDRRKKMNAAFSAAMGSRLEDSTRAERHSDPVPSREGTVQRESTLFDAEAVAARPKPLTAMELREAALAVALAAGDDSAAQTVNEPATAEDTSWEPVEVPKPTYVEAAKADRPAPEPLDLPESPKAVGKPSLKQGPAAAPDVASPNAGPARPLTKAQSALSNLDDVLQRRRA